jgi:ABC-type nitrate/sulfonate/bicarbonate transport system ATPase subunit
MNGFEPLLILQDVVLPFGTIASISLQVYPSQILLITGENGTGKSTLLNCVAGLQQPKSGSITRRTSRVGYFVQSARIFWNLTVIENILIGLKAQDKGVVGLLRSSKSYCALWSDRIEATLNEFQLTRYRSRPAALLSGGELQRLRFAQITASAPELLLLDEPFADLDEPSSEIIANAVNRLSLSAAIVLVTHKVVPKIHPQQSYAFAA